MDGLGIHLLLHGVTVVQVEGVVGGTFYFLFIEFHCAIFPYPIKY